VDGRLLGREVVGAGRAGSVGVGREGVAVRVLRQHRHLAYLREGGDVRLLAGQAFLYRVLDGIVHDLRLVHPHRTIGRVVDRGFVPERRFVRAELSVVECLGTSLAVGVTHWYTDLIVTLVRTGVSRP